MSNSNQTTTQKSYYERKRQEIIDFRKPKKPRLDPALAVDPQDFKEVVKGSFEWRITPSPPNKSYLGLIFESGTDVVCFSLIFIALSGHCSSSS